MDPQLPTSSLPPLRSLAAHSLASVTAALINLRALYWPASLPRTSVRASKSHKLPREHIPDSGYASAEEDTDVNPDEGEIQEDERLDVLRADAMERAFAVRWLTGLIARSEEWIAAPRATSEDSRVDKEQENRMRVVEEAAALLALCADTNADGALVRQFSFPVGGYGEADGQVVVELWDEPLDAGEHDHESVGLQTWGSACVLAERLCADPSAFFGKGGEAKVRILELGAGTGLLSMVVAKLDVNAEVVATDYHPAVLENLRGNVARNFPSGLDVVRVEELDWVQPRTVPETDKYDVVLAADVIYDARHGGWIKHCAEGLLRRRTGVMWMIVPRRPTRGGEVAGVDDVFAAKEGEVGLKILEVEDVGRTRGVGRADEVGYRLFRIGW